MTQTTKSARARRFARTPKTAAIEAQPTIEASPDDTPQPAKALSKISQVIALLQRPEGATLAELVAATGWLPHTARAALTGLRKKGHRYYVSKAKHHRLEASLVPAMRLPAPEIEKVVRDELDRLLQDPLGLAKRVGVDVEPHAVDIILRRAATLRADLGKTGAEVVRRLVSRIVIHADRITLTLRRTWLADVTGLAETPTRIAALHDISARLTRTGRVVRLVDETGAAKGSSAPDESLVRLVVTARRWWAELSKGELDITALSAREKVSASYMTRVVRLAFLAPAVTEAVLSGAVRAEISGKGVLQAKAIPSLWTEQVERLLPRADI